MIDEYLLRTCGFAFFCFCVIGGACLIKFLVLEVMSWRGMSIRGLLLSDWTPADIEFHYKWKRDWWWA